MKLIKRSYDDGYFNQIGYRESENSQRNQARLALVLEHCPDGGRLLEIGCGQGGFLRLAESHFDVTGVDVSHQAVKALRPHFGERVSTLNIEQRPLTLSGFQVVAAFNILEHLRQPEKAVRKLAAALEPGGVLVGSVPNNSGAAGRVVTQLGNFFDRTHVSTFTPPTWRRIFEHAGFSRVDFFGEVTLGRNRCAYIRRPLWPQVSFNLMFVCQK
jgi:2-polyprenyl-3-methyl-5-hydroxy-6-metoxy-1,4-benzoquinol methylase